ncbi:helix-turn-helix domain-containing protein [Microbacterium immunditiarum]|uniref:Helix-turn-helix domain-containing protein n=1 Tax=Microbacterium immunditiarum TaxID=337480 RepID=A0A7Y9KKZ8_9MICO|nr:helix-turn-helix domain-containing protein [Microbacterium immunditiarum]NYE21385.1 hypothetical protein [Microbacterium immunditiarum]
MLSVQEYAKASRLSPARVYQLIQAGQIPAQKVGRAWVVDESALRRKPMSRRSLSPRMAHLVLDALAQEKPAGIDSRRWLRAQAHADAITSAENPAALLRDLMRNRGQRLDLRVQPDFLGELRSDPRVHASGFSDPRSGIDDRRQLEGHVRPADLAAVQADFMLIPHPEANVRLHVSDRPPRISESIADLADWDGPREDGEVARMLEAGLPR